MFVDNELNFSIAFYSFILIYVLINTLLVSILFKRAGVESWKAFVPFYGGFTLHKLAFGEEARWFWFLNLVLQDIYGIYQRYSFVKSFGKSTGFAILAIFFPTITNCILVFSDAEYEGPQKHLFMR